MVNIGNGYIWPPITIYSDGVRTVLYPQIMDFPVHDWIRYTSAVPVVLPTQDFQLAAKNFIDICVARLCEKGVENTMLQRFWEEWLDEQDDLEILQWRKIEAMLGYATGEAGIEIFQQMEDLENFLGIRALEDIVPQWDQGWTQVKLRDWLMHNGIEKTEGARLPVVSEIIDPHKPAWIVGQDMARSLRDANTLDSQITNKVLAEFYGVDPKALAESRNTVREFGFSMYSKNERKVVFSSPWQQNRRFAIARLIADEMMDNINFVHVAGESKTHRQKIQRAFAAEFLCPASALDNFFDGKMINDDTLQEAAERFDVSTRVVEHSLENRKKRDPIDEVAAA
jgi:hypothetical protein